MMLTGFGALLQSADEHPEGVDLLLSKPVNLSSLVVSLRKVHGRVSASWGENASASTSAGDVKIVRSRRSTTALAMMSRPTQGVKRLEGERFIEPRL